MKKNLVLFAAAAMMFGLASCTDDPIEPIIEPVDNNALVKSTADLIGTEWEYTMEDIALVDEDGDTIVVIPMDDMVFGLDFDSNYAHIAFPDIENLTVLTLTEDAEGNPTLEELSGLDYAYNYDGTTHTGSLTAGYYEEDGTWTTAMIPFTYDTTDDAIIIEVDVEDGNGAETTLQLVFNRI